MDGICYIISAGECTGINFLKRENDCVIAVDKGYRTAMNFAVDVDMVMGDFDSLGYVPKADNLLRFNSDKDYTDTFLAVKKGLELGYKNYIIYGGLGKREDHSLANIFMLKYLSERKCKAILVGEREKITSITDGRLDFSEEFYGADKENRKYFSVFALDEKCLGVAITHARYELEDATMSNDFTIGISNEYISEAFPVIEVKKGTLIVSYDVSD